MPYHVKLSQFEGPLDLLLHLISNAKIRIEDIFVSEITEQYMRHMESMDELDMDRASEFLQMAAMLIYIKSRTLLPRHIEEEEEEFLEQELISQLKQYKAYKDICETLKVLEEEAVAVFYKLAEEFHGERKVSLEGVTLEGLRGAYLEALQRKKQYEEEQNPKPLSISKETFSVKEKICFLLMELSRNDTVSFFSLLKGVSGREETAVIFLAVLELIQRNEITIRQQNSFADIYMYKSKKAG